MSLNNAAVVTAPTSIAATGGTALTLASAGSDGITNRLIVTADTDFRTRRSIVASIKTPKPLATAPNGYTQARSKAVYTKPKLLANTKYTNNTISIEISVDVETTQTEIQELMDVGAQMLFDADFIQLWKTQNLT